MHLLVVIPDIHHDWDWLHQILTRYSEETRYVFLGDYFDYKHTRTYNHLQSLEWLLKTIDQLGDKATWLIGNHDLHYHPVCLSGIEMLVASGFNYEAAQTISDNVPWAKLHAAHAEAGFLFTHAGLAIFEALSDLTAPTTLATQINASWGHFGSPPTPAYLSAIGWGSGGKSDDGSIFWHRPEEGPLAAVPQMMGHTPMLTPTLSLPPAKQFIQQWYLDTQQNFWAEINPENQEVVPRSLANS